MACPPPPDIIIKRDPLGRSCSGALCQRVLSKARALTVAATLSPRSALTPGGGNSATCVRATRRNTPVAGCTRCRFAFALLRDSQGPGPLIRP